MLIILVNRKSYIDRLTVAGCLAKLWTVGDPCIDRLGKVVYWCTTDLSVSLLKATFLGLINPLDCGTIHLDRSLTIQQTLVQFQAWHSQLIGQAASKHLFFLDFFSSQSCQWSLGGLIACFLLLLRSFLEHLRSFYALGCFYVSSCTAATWLIVVFFTWWVRLFFAIFAKSRSLLT